MRVLVLSDLFLPKIGGTEIQASRLAAGLVGRGHVVEVWSGRWDAAWPQQEEIDGYPVHRLPCGPGWMDRPGLRRYRNLLYMKALGSRLAARGGEFDIVHAQSLLYGAAVAVAWGDRTGVPVLVKETNSGLRSSYRELSELFRGGWLREQFHRHLHHVAVLNGQAAREYAGWPFLALQVHPAVNGIPLVDDPGPRPETDGERTLLFVGRMRAEKGATVLAEAWAQVAPRHPGWKLRMVGDGIERPEVERILAEGGVAGRTELTGYSRDTASEYRRAHAFVLPSLSEGMSNALLEAMAHHLPCLATEVGAGAEMLGAGAGWTCAAGDSPALAAAIDAVLSSPGEAARRARAARQRVEERYSIGASVRRYEEIYGEILGDVP